MVKFCKHKWIVLNETTTESIVDQITKRGTSFTITPETSLVVWERKFIQVFVCERCGSFKRFVHNI